jgi:hypothetical protein
MRFGSLFYPRSVHSPTRELSAVTRLFFRMARSDSLHDVVEESEEEPDDPTKSAVMRGASHVPNKGSSDPPPNGLGYTAWGRRSIVTYRCRSVKRDNRKDRTPSLSGLPVHRQAVSQRRVAGSAAPRKHSSYVGTTSNTDKEGTPTETRVATVVHQNPRSTHDVIQSEGGSTGGQQNVADLLL